MDMTQLFDTAPLASDTVAFTVMICSVFLIFGLLPILICRMDRDPLHLIVTMPMTPLFSGLTILFFLSVPRGYTVESDRIIIKRLLSDVVIEFRDIAGVEETDTFAWQGKNGWNAGVFGYVGTYRSESFGRFSAYLTNWKYLVIITRRDARPVVISPRSPAQFVWRCNTAINAWSQKYERETTLSD